MPEQLLVHNVLELSPAYSLFFFASLHAHIIDPNSRQREAGFAGRRRRLRRGQPGRSAMGQLFCPQGSVLRCISQSIKRCSVFKEERRKPGSSSSMY